MQKIYQFFRLIRFSNILVIVMTMSLFYGLLSNYRTQRLYLLSDIHDVNEILNRSFYKTIGFTDFNFILLIISVVLIASSGNIINDYFDQKADRVNKPDRIIIDKYIKRRWAIILNWTFNGIGFLIALYLTYTLQNWWIIAISFLSINLLYFYSAIYKRKFLTGNIFIAFLTAIVPFYVFAYGAFSNFYSNSPFGNYDELFVFDNLEAVVVYSGFAFLLNLMREIIKDMADVKGDLLLKSRTFPIRYGFKKTKYFLGILYFFVIVPLGYFIIKHLLLTTIVQTNGLLTFIYLLVGVVILLLLSLFVLFTHNQRKYYLIASNLLKFAMLFGVISALFYS